MSAEARHVSDLDVFQVLQRLDSIAQQMLHRKALGKRTVLDDNATESLRKADHTMEKMSIDPSTQGDFCKIWRPVDRSTIVMHAKARRPWELEATGAAGTLREAQGSCRQTRPAERGTPLKTPWFFQSF